MKKIYSCRRYPPKEDIRGECDQRKVSSVNEDMLIKTADISMFEGIMPKLTPLHNIEVMETVWEAQHLSKKERIQFLIDIM